MPQQQSTHAGDLHVTGHFRAGSMTVPAGSVGNEQIDPGNPIGADKQEHQLVLDHAQNHGAAAVDQRVVRHRAYAPGEVISVVAGVTQACVGDSTISVDVHKNGVSILSSLSEINSVHAAYDSVLATVDPAEAEYEAGDVFEIIIDATVGTGTLGQGLFVSIVVREEAAP